MFCHLCGEEILSNAKFCGKCGTSAQRAHTTSAYNDVHPAPSFWTKKRNKGLWLIVGPIGLLGITLFSYSLLRFAIGEPDTTTARVVNVVMGLIGIIAVIGMLVGIPWGIWLINKSDTARRRSGEHGELKGLHGWLILVGIGLLAAIIQTGYGVYTNITMFRDGTIELISNPRSSTLIVGYAGAIKFELIGLFVFFAAAIYLSYLFAKQRREFPKYYIYFLITAVAFSLVEYAWLSQLTTTDEELKKILTETVSKAETQIGKAFWGALIWGLYMKSSQRVKATFIE